MRERIGVFGAILQRLAQREIEMEAMLGVEIITKELRAHRRDLVVAEAEGLEIGETPIRLAEAGIERDAAAIGGDGLVLTPGGLQRVAVAHPHPRVVRIFAEDRFVQFDAGVVFAETAQDCSLQRAAAGIARIVGEQGFELGQRRLRLLFAVQHQRVVLARLAEPGRELQATFEQMQRVFAAPDPHRQFGEHADRGDIGRVLLQPVAEQRFGIGQTIVGQGFGRLQHARVARRMTDVGHVRGVGAFGIADAAQVVGQGQPGLRQGGIERECAPQRGDGVVATTGAAERQPEFAVHLRRTRLLP